MRLVILLVGGVKPSLKRMKGGGTDQVKKGREAKARISVHKQTPDQKSTGEAYCGQKPEGEYQEKKVAKE